MTQKVLHILPSLDCSGCCTQLAMLATDLPARGFGMSILSMGGDGPMRSVYEAHGIPVHAVEPKLQEFATGLRRIRRLAQQHAPDLIHTWSLEQNLLGRVAAAAMRVPRVIVSYGSIPKRRSWHSRMCEGLLNRYASSYVVDSRATCDSLRDKLPAEKLNHIPLAIDALVPKLTTLEKRALRNEWQIPEGAKLIGAIGPLYASKRIKDLIWAADLLKVIRDDVYLVIIGAGPYRPQLERYRKQVRIADKVRFVGQHRDAPRIVGALDCLWQASNEIGSPNAVLEAMAAGVPVVATDTKTHREIIIPDETGLMVNTGRRAEFARKTRALLDTPELSQRIAERAREEVVARFSKSQMVDRFVKLYEAR